MAANLYNDIGVGYAASRQPDPRIAQLIRAAIGSASSLVNVGAGAGSYEPEGVATIAVEPSEVMIGQRRVGAAPVVQALAEALPFPDDAFDVGMAILTIHHWSDAVRGLGELQRVSQRQVILTWDRDVTAENFWFARDYFPAASERERDIPTLREILDIVGRDARVEPVPVPADCVDGFYAAYWARPHAYLDPSIRAGISALALSDQQEVAEAVARLAGDLRSGLWLERYADLLKHETADMGYRLILVPSKS